MRVMIEDSVVEVFEDVVFNTSAEQVEHAKTLLAALIAKVPTNPSLLTRDVKDADPYLQSLAHLTKAPPGLNEDQRARLSAAAQKLAASREKERSKRGMQKQRGLQAPPLPTWLVCAVNFPNARPPMRFFVVHEYSNARKSVEFHFVIAAPL